VVVHSPASEPPLLSNFNERRRNWSNWVVRVNRIEVEFVLVVSLHIESILAGSRSFEPAIEEMRGSARLGVLKSLERRGEHRLFWVSVVQTISPVWCDIFIGWVYESVSDTWLAGLRSGDRGSRLGSSLAEDLLIG